MDELLLESTFLEHVPHEAESHILNCFSNKIDFLLLVHLNSHI